MAFSINHTDLPVSVSGANHSYTGLASSTGNCILVGIICDEGATCTAVTDNLSQVYTLNATSASDATGSAGRCFFAYKFGASTGATSVVLTNTAGGIAIVRYDLASATGGAFDNIAALNAKTNVTNPANSVLAAGAGFSAGLIASVNGMTGTSGAFTQDLVDGSGLSNFSDGAHDINGAGGTLTCTWTSANSAAWSSLLIALKEAGATSVLPGWAGITSGPSYAI